jgi:hypothetical protein
LALPVNTIILSSATTHPLMNRVEYSRGNTAAETAAEKQPMNC